jgi:hypothetical protein
MRSSVLFLSIFLVLARASVLSDFNIETIVEEKGVETSRQPFISKVSTDFPPWRRVEDGKLPQIFSYNPRISGLYSGDLALHGYSDNRVLHSGSFDVKIFNSNVFKMNTFGFYAKGVQHPICVEFFLNGESVGKLTDFLLHRALPLKRKFRYFPWADSSAGYIHFVLTKGRFDQVKIRSVQPFDSDTHVFGFLEVDGHKLVKQLTEGSIVSASKEDEAVQTKEESSAIEAVPTKEDEAVQTKEESSVIEAVPTKKDEAVQTKEESSAIEAVPTKEDEAVQTKEESSAIEAVPTKEDEAVQTKEEPSAVKTVQTKKDEAVKTEEKPSAVEPVPTKKTHQPSGLFQLEKKQVQGKPSGVADTKSGSAKYSIATGMIAVLLFSFL